MNYAAQPGIALPGFVFPSKVKFLKMEKSHLASCLWGKGDCSRVLFDEQYLDTICERQLSIFPWLERNQKLWICAE